MTEPIFQIGHRFGLEENEHLKVKLEGIIE